MRLSISLYSHTIAILAWVAITCSPRNLIASDREYFLRAVSTEVLDSDLPIRSETGWTGVLLPPVGSSLSAYTTNYEALGSRLANNTQILADSYLFDRPLDVRNGIGFPKRRRLSEAWEKVLKQTMPLQGDFLDVLIERDPVNAKWLFRLSDRVDTKRRTEALREPSEYFLRYREYQLTYQLLLSSKSAISSNDDSWRLHPRLARYKTAAAAEEGILSDWLEYGYKKEVDFARERFEAAPEMKQWMNWSMAVEHYEVSQIILDRGLRVPRTSLSPVPSEWLRMGTWRRFSLDTEDRNNHVEFEYARVKVIRDWFRLDMLLDGRLVVDEENVVIRNVSNGEPPTTTKYPSGDMSVVVDELILSRNIRWDHEAPLQHPLAGFASPNEMQLIAYIVFALPKLKSPVNSEVSNDSQE